MIIIKVKQQRMKNGLTQRQLAEETGISKSNIDRIEKGDVRASLEDICEIAHTLGVPEQELYEYHYLGKNPQP